MPAASICGVSERDDAGDHLRPCRVAGRDVALDAEAGDLRQARRRQERHEPRADGRVGTRGAERGQDPADQCRGERGLRLGPGGADVEVDRHERPAGPQPGRVVADDVDGVGEVEQHQPLGHRVERLGIAERARVGMLVADVRGACRRASLLGVAEHPLVGLDADDLAARADQLGEQERDVTEAGAQIEDAHPLPDAGGAEQRDRRLRDRPRLELEPRDLRRVAAEHVGSWLVGAHASLHAGGVHSYATEP